MKISGSPSWQDVRICKLEKRKTYKNVGGFMELNLDGLRWLQNEHRKGKVSPNLMKPKVKD
jgi:hypothetical protein